ncbi:MAG: hypothetical protein HRU70_13750 [Phycisphaeraceae bacterium]|nr:MAG: hypothetical protein HRU70_13750 [Phycisphaeraceae bacterium]
MALVNAGRLASVGVAAVLLVSAGAAVAFSGPEPAHHKPEAKPSASGPAVKSSAYPETKSAGYTPGLKVTETKHQPAPAPVTVSAASKAPAPAKADHASGGHGSSAVSADQALAWLEEGNARWVSGKAEHPGTDRARREAQAEGQTPFVAVLTCADSRLPVERVFDRGVGEVFAVRVAGNVAGTSEGGTLEYGVSHLGIPVVVVMGHTKCGAVAAAAGGGEVHGQVGALVEEIRPAVARARSANPDADEKGLVSAAVRENVWQSVLTLLKNNDTIRGKVRGGEVRIVGAVYDVTSGKVEFLGAHPYEAELVAAFDARAASKTRVAGADDHGH